MAIECVAADSHLANTSSSGFTRSVEPFSITAWVNTQWTGATKSLIGMYGPVVTPTTALQIGARLDQVSFWAFGGAIYVSTPAPPDNTWAFIAYTYDGTTHRTYVNGIPGNTSAIAVPNNEQYATIYINGYPTGLAAETAAYQLDSYYFYNRTLSAAEVLSMFNAFGARHFVTDGLVAALEFNENVAGSSATLIRDQSGNGNHLAASGATSAITYIYNGAVASSNLRRVL